MLKTIVNSVKTPDGVRMNLWNHEDDGGYTIMLYPKAKRDSHYGWIRKGEKFCLCLSNFSKGNEIEVFRNLQTGVLKIEDCWKYFHDPFKGAYYLGWIDSEEVTDETYNMWKQEVETK